TRPRRQPYERMQRNCTGCLRRCQAPCFRQLWHLSKSPHVMRRYDDQLGQALFERDHTQQVFAVRLRIRISPSTGDPRALLALGDSFQLPHNVTHKRVAPSVGQRYKCDDTPGSMPERRYDYDRTVTVNVAAGGKSEVRPPFESILHIIDAGKESAK